MNRLWDPWQASQSLRGKTVLLAMSGGVDSSAAAVVLQQQGAHVLGLTMKNFCFSDVEDDTNTSCCSLSHLMDARQVCDQLGIEHYVLDTIKEFEAKVLDPFVDEYAAGRTPNPCVDCNQSVRFPLLWEKARELGADLVATGHYARVHRDDNGKHFLLRGLDRAKDQSYFLHGISTGALEKIVFPLGEYVKDEVRELASTAGLSVAKKSESQEICFLPNGGRQGFLAEHGVKPAPGILADLDGNELAKHEGVGNFTVGQRRGLNLALGYPAYVKSIDAASATVVVCDAANLNSHGMVLDPYWKSADFDVDDIEVQLRYRSPPVRLSSLAEEGSFLRVKFFEPQKSVAPGQAAVFYEGEAVVGGGRILSVF